MHEPNADEFVVEKAIWLEMVIEDASLLNLMWMVMLRETTD